MKKNRSAEKWGSCDGHKEPLVVRDLTKDEISRVSTQGV